MSRRLESNVNDIRRNYLMSMNLVRVVTWWALIVVIFFGFFGIRPLAVVVINKLRLIAEMKQVNENLHKNVDTISAAAQSLSLAGTNLGFLYSYVPDSPKIHDYLVELLVLTSETGFSIQRYSPIYSEDLNKTELSVLFEGNGDPVELIDKIEKLKRVTKIVDIKITPRDIDSPTKITAVLEIYYF